MEPSALSGPPSQSALAASPSIAALAAAQPFLASASSSCDEGERTLARSPKTLLMVAASAAMREDGYVTPPLREYPKEYAKYQIHPMELEKFVAGANGVAGAMEAVTTACTTSPLVLSNASAGNKRKRLEFTGSVNSRHDQIAAQQIADMHKGEMGGESHFAAAARKRKGSGDFLRKGQWTTTEERLARLLIEAFEEGYLPIYTGIRLRGYLAVQLQCDPMRISKKLCAGVVDGKKIPKNYGQKKFKLRKKQIWDRDEAGRTLAMLEALTSELWKETGITQPSYLSLSSTRSLEDESVPGNDVVRMEDQPSMSNNSGSTLKNRTTSKVAKKHKPVVFPIIYLNLSKKLKHATGSNYASVQEGDGMESSSSSSTINDADSTSRPNAQQQPSSVTQISPPPTTTVATTSTSNTAAAGSSSPHQSSSPSISPDAAKSIPNTTDQPFSVDGESLQAAYELLHLYHQESQPQPLQPSVRG